MKKPTFPSASPSKNEETLSGSESAIRNPQSAIRIPCLGHETLTFDSLPSTSDMARDLARQGAAEGLVILARGQTSGRGRQGRSWASPAGHGLYLSIVLRPPLEPASATILTLAAAVGVAETLSIDYGVPVDIKWPNDICARGRKICGILVESAVDKGELEYAILGIGVNLQQREFTQDLRETATSFFIESGTMVSPDELLTPLLARLEKWYRVSLANPARILERWQELSSYARDCAIRIESGDSAIEGITRGLAASGALLVELSNGETREIWSGEVRLRKA